MNEVLPVCPIDLRRRSDLELRLLFASQDFVPQSSLEILEDARNRGQLLVEPLGEVVPLRL